MPKCLGVMVALVCMLVMIDVKEVVLELLRFQAFLVGEPKGHWNALTLHTLQRFLYWLALDVALLWNLDIVHDVVCIVKEAFQV